VGGPPGGAASVIGDGQPAEDGEAARGLEQRGGGAALVALPLRQSVRGAGGRGESLRLGASRRPRGAVAGEADGALRPAALLGVVDEVAARAVRAEAGAVEGAARLRLVLGVPAHAALLALAVGELALVSVLTAAALLEGPAQLRLVAARVDGAAGPRPVPELGEEALADMVPLVVVVAQP